MRLTKNFETELNLSKLFYNRSVAVIGGSQLIDWEAVRDCEILIHVNGHHLGKHTHTPLSVGVYVRGSITPFSSPGYHIAFVTREGDHVADWVRHRQDEIDLVLVSSETFNLPNPYGPEHEWASNLVRLIKSNPLTGVLAAFHMSRFPFKRIVLTGFTFYSEFGFVPYQRDSHMLLPQVAALAQLSRDRRVVCDANLEAVLSGAVPLQASGIVRAEVRHDRLSL